MTDHEDAVENHRQRNYPQKQAGGKYCGHLTVFLPVYCQHEAAEEGDEVADGGVVPDPVGKGQEEDNDDGHVGDTVQRYHPVNEVVLLDLQPQQHQQVDDENCHVGRNKGNHVQ